MAGVIALSLPLGRRLLNTRPAFASATSVDGKGGAENVTAVGPGVASGSGGFNVYTATAATVVTGEAAAFPERVYVPDTTGATVELIDPATYDVVAHFPVGQIPYHITPSWDLTQLFVGNEGSSSLTPIDPVSGSSYLDSLPRLDEQKGARLRTIEGLPPDLINPGAECRFSPRCKYVHDRCRVEEPELSARDGVGHLARCFGTEPGGWIK